MELSKAQILAAQHPQCGWGTPQLQAALDKRIQSDPVDFATLCQSWAEDRTLRHTAKQQAAILAVRIVRKYDPDAPPLQASPLFAPAIALRELATRYGAAGGAVEDLGTEGG